MTKANQHEAWLQFEAGALARTLDEETRVCPYLTDMNETDLISPLTAFQSVKADEVGTRKLLNSINSAMALTGGRDLERAKESICYVVERS